MDKKVVCMFNLFDLHQHIMVCEDDEMRLAAVSELDKLGSDIAFICDKGDINKVHLYGNGTYASRIVEQMVQTNNTKYGNRVIDVEIN